MPSKAEALSEYELQRQENIKRNRELLLSLNLVTETSTLSESPEVDTVQTKPPEEEPKVVRKRTQRKKPEKEATKAVPKPSRISKRLKGEAPVEDASSENQEDNSIPELDHILKTAEEYFSKEICENAIKVSGKYKGWINPELMERHGFEASAAEAWEKNGGGKFSFKDPLGTGEKKGRKGKKNANGWSDAKLVASKLFKKNPNAYFYRHVEPGVEQWTGDWTEEEKTHFLKVAAEFGCGDKWGLFSSYIPHRVGYQCSNFYRQYVLPEGLIFDPNYQLTSSGKAIYVGPHMKSAKVLKELQDL
ncbi:hypothetical protein K493DRAFT_284294 [Basidiobolus meristosporus CBS 931.73]|uniref:Myb-like domain-containing protein n=1 Tax=Basidiobolus meristosporus CBS 931.73 TaxID=1314790 RepID=A0A1Y1Y753_9FUNG|nr:hypothetical protein K493DRAFT_284294 [Basidiobolus meristosporus CBS 931.73]|eukprot:ORX93837.1 hypothetical protein K493DRAFT_284294 [Basidiobolus meristosporus CBS 931.73]